MVKDRAPRYEVLENEVGTTYGAYRPAEDGHDLLAHRPLHVPVLRPDPHGRPGHGRPGPGLGAAGRRPHDVLGLADRRHRTSAAVASRAPTPTPATGRPVNAAAPPSRAGFEYLPSTSDWLGRWRLDQNEDNDYQIDREAQARARSFTGIRGVRQQDKAVAESMGPSHGPHQRAPRHVRLDGHPHAAPHAPRREGAARPRTSTPPGVDKPELYRQRSGSIIMPRDVDWLSATQHLRHPDVPIGAPAEPKPAS